MPTVRRVKKIEISRPITFDDQLWPINVALVVLSGFVAGCVVALSSFDDERVLYNGWVRLATLGVSVGILLAAVNYIENRRWRRSMQLAVVLSCLFHVVLMAVLYNQRMAYLTHREAESDNAAVPEDVVLPDYHIQAPDAPPQDFEKPVEVEHPPDPEQTEPEIKHQTPRPEDRPTESQPTPAPGTTPEVQPSTMKMAEVEQAAPRRSDQTSALSRQTLKVESASQAQVDAPADRPSDEPQARLDAQAKPIERQAAQVTPERPQEMAEPVRAPERQAAQLTRRESSEPDARLASSSATLPRRVNEPAATPRGAAEAPQSEAAAEQPSPTQPSVIVSRREASGPAAAMQPSPEPKAAAAVEVARLEAPRTEANDQPQVAPTAQKVMSRQAEGAQLPAATAAQVPQVATASGEAAGSLAPAATQVARSQTEAPAAASAAPSSAVPAATTPSAMAGAALARAEVSAQPSLNPAAAPSRAIARAAVPAAVEASPLPVDSPAAAEAPSGSQPQAAPTQTALAKGSAGVFGGGAEANFDRGLPSTQQPAPVASMSASRPANLQSGPEGPALAPSAPAAISKSLAGANVPLAKLTADDVAVPDAVGAPRPGPIEASSSAAIRKADGRGQPSTTSAAAGSGEIDLGPTQVVASAGAGRAAGGGAPNVHLNTQMNQITRSNQGGAPLAALAAPAAAPSPAAPAGEGGGSPAAMPAPGPVAAVARAGGEAALPTASAGQPAAGASGAGTPAGAVGPAAVSSAPVARADGSRETVPGPVAPGGSKLPTRSLGSALVADAKADAPQLPAGPTTDEAPASAPGQPGGAQAPIRSVAGLPGAAQQGPVGAAEGPTAVDTALVGAPGLGVRAPGASPAGEAAPTVGSIAAAGPVRKVNVAGVPGGSAAPIDAPLAEGAPTGNAAAQAPGVAAAAADSTGRRAGSLPVQVAALEGPGGLGAEVTAQAGSLSRRAQRDSEVIHAGTERFIGRTLGGPLAVEGKAREPAQAYSRRGGQRITKAGHPEQPLERTEETIELGLDFLARHQSADGSWSLNHFGTGRPGYEKEEALVVSDTAATGLALLSFLGAGYDHYDDQYQNVIRSGLEFMLRVQKPNGDLYVAADPESNKSAWFYSHGIASIALCEAYGMTGDENLRAPAQKAIDFIVASQHPSRGGWRYVPQFDADTSVSGWQLMALKSGELAGLKIPPGTYDKVRRWLDGAQGSPRDPSQYVYNPNNPVNQPQGRRPSTTMTAVGLLMRMYTGWNRNDPRMVKAAQQLMANLPEIGTAAQPKRDTYYWYYATQVMFHMKGNYWQVWNERLHPLLLERQIRTGPMAGSWDPLGPIPDRWGRHGGRIYVTTLNLLSLEIVYRHLPIYESEAK